MQLALYAVPAAFVLLFALEQAFPLRRTKSPLLRRLFVNACVAALALGVAAILVRPLALALLEHSSGFGVLSVVTLPRWAQWMAGFLLLDLSFYYWHRGNHAWRFLWRFHNAHHVDPDLDTSTAFRFHFMEIGFSAGFRAIQVVTIGGPPSIFIAYELAFQLNTLFQHSNVRLPVTAERWLSRVLVTPRMHGVHHSKVREENNSNWSSVFSFWDRAHGTLRLNVPQSEVDVGMAGYSLPGDNRVENIVLMPFRRQRDYWRGADGQDQIERSSAERSPSRMAE